MRTILHSDLNNFYASVECLKHPEYRGMPLAVLGDKEDRHGIVLAKNQEAKKYGIATGDVYWQAKKKCYNLIEITADFAAYIAMSKAVRGIYEDYTDTIEAFGIDECWLDVTESVNLFGGGEAIAEEIRERVKTELGLTVSIGVSWNKIFAKLGSDMKKPDAITVITEDNYRDLVWRLPVEELLYVGKATMKKLNDVNIKTIGDLANHSIENLKARLGKWGEYLHAFANGEDISPVMPMTTEENIKSIGNSITNYVDLYDEDEVRTVVYLLAESVTARMREVGLNKARTVHIGIRDSKLNYYGKQTKLPYASGFTEVIAEVAMKMFVAIYPWEEAVRSVSISVSGFETGDTQLNMFEDYGIEEKKEKFNETLDKIRGKYGNNIIQRAIILKDQKLKNMDVKGDHTIHPYSFFRNK